MCPPLKRAQAVKISDAKEPHISENVRKVETKKRNSYASQKCSRSAAKWEAAPTSGNISTHPMTGSPNTSKTLCLRVLLCAATLFALCTSNNVGLSFLPLPLVADHQTEVQKLTDREQLSRAPSHSDTQSVRVPITTYSQKREAKQPHSQPLAVTLKTRSVVSNDTRVSAEFNSAVQLYVSALASQPPGRAPPV